MGYFAALEVEVYVLIQKKNLQVYNVKQKRGAAMV